MSLCRRLALSAALLILAMSSSTGCPPEINDGTVERSSPENSPLSEKMHRLDVQYEILLKDNPTTNETYPFRQKLGQADKALSAGRTDEARKLLAEAEQWIIDARAKYYREHETAIVAGRSKETGNGLMTDAEKFVALARQAKAKGDAWAAGQYFEAAIEQGELALLATQRKPEQALELIGLSERMETVYRAAGKPDKAAAARERVVHYLLATIADIDKSIKQCLNEKKAECRRQALVEDEQNYKKVVAKMQKQNELRNRIAVEADKYVANRFRVLDYTNNIAFFNSRWSGYWEPGYKPKQPEDDNNLNEVEEMLRKELTAHDSLKKGAVSPQAKGMSLQQTGILLRGESIIIKGTFANLGDKPIYKPRVTVVGGKVMSEIKDLGYPRMDPMMTTSFQLALKHFNVNAYDSSGQRVPPHELLLIFEDQNGRQVKILQPAR